MKYPQFKKIDNIEEKLLRILGAISEIKKIIRIDHYPDFDLTNYDKFSSNTYFFKNYWGFDCYFNSVIRWDIGYIKVFSDEDFYNLSEEYNIEYNSSIKQEEFLNEIVEGNSDFMWHEGMDANFDDFSLNNISVDFVDNIKKEIAFSGAYETNSFGIQPEGWAIFLECNLVGMKKSNEKTLFYQELLAEAYTQKLFKNFKLSYFITFSALESYVNEKMNSHNEKRRLKDVINDMFKQLTIEVNKNKIYTSIINEFKEYEIVRNKIAHGRKKITISNDFLKEFILFTLVIISSSEGKGTTFEELKNNISR